MCKKDSLDLQDLRESNSVAKKYRLCATNYWISLFSLHYLLNLFDVKAASHVRAKCSMTEMLYSLRDLFKDDALDFACLQNNFCVICKQMYF